MNKTKDIKIVMNAMVGNEANTITRMLESVADHIDYYVVQCNGKEDNTKEIIDTFFTKKGIPGFTYEIDWNFPGFNRDHTLQKCLAADHGCDWVLRMDADEQLSVTDDFDWTPFTNLETDSFNIVADPGDSLYLRTWLWNAHRPWYFTHDKRHETIHLPNRDDSENFSRVNLDRGFSHIITNDGETWEVPMKFLSDALELEKDKVPSNLVLEDNYHLWYIGKSYSDSYGNPNEFPFGMDHAKEYARRAIFYFNMYLNKTHNYSNTKTASYTDDMGYYAMFLLGAAYDFIGETKTALEYLDAASLFNPKRNEAIYKRAELFERLGNFTKMLKCTKQLVEITRVNPFPDSAFMLHNSAYYDTSPLPTWMHIKALKSNKLDYSDTVQRLQSKFNELPEYITNSFQPTEQTDSTSEEPTSSTGVFGITR